MTASHEAHKWEFKARFRRHAFGWKSQPAIQRVKQAVSEIGKVARANPVWNAAEIRGRIQKLVAGEKAGSFVARILGREIGQ